MSEQAVFDALKYRIEVDISGTRRYYNAANQLHRDEGPAIEWRNGTKSWFQYGIRHRTDGAAIEYSDGDKAWYINGEELTEDEFNQRVKKCLNKRYSKR